MPGRVLLAMLIVHGLVILLLTWLLRTGEERRIAAWGRAQVNPPAAPPLPPMEP